MGRIESGVSLKDFVQIGEYANRNWRCKFSQQEVLAYAKELYADFLFSLEQERMEHSIQTLCTNLMEDIKNNKSDPTEPTQWLFQIADSLGLIDMDAADYRETDDWLFF